MILANRVYIKLTTYCEYWLTLPGRYTTVVSFNYHQEANTINNNNLSHLMRLLHFSSSIHSFFKNMCSHPGGLNVWFLVGPFVFFHTLCVRTVKALVRLHRLALAFGGCLCDKDNNLMSWLISLSNLNTGPITGHIVSFDFRCHRHWIATVPCKNVLKRKYYLFCGWMNVMCKIGRHGNTSFKALVHLCWHVFVLTCFFSEIWSGD